MQEGVAKPNCFALGKVPRTDDGRDGGAPNGDTSALATERDHKGRFAPGNLFRWSSGQSGNPGGRPKGASFAAALARHAVTPVSCAPTGLWELWR